MPSEPFIQTDSAQSDYRDFELLPNGDLKLTKEVVLQDSFKSMMLTQGNFVYNRELGNEFYKLIPFGNILATRELGRSYIRRALENDIGIDNIDIIDIDVSRITRNGCDYTVRFEDLTTDIEFTLTNLA